jgi:hypothetical protein
MLRPAWTSILLFMLPLVAGMTGTHHHTQPLIEIGGSRELFVQAGFEPQSSRSLSPSLSLSLK